MKTILPAILLIILAISNTSNAGTTYYDSMSRGYNNPGSAMIGTWLHNDMMNMSMRSKLNQMVQKNQQGKSLSSVKSTDYRLTDLSVSRQTVTEQFVKNAQGLSAAQSRELLKALKEGIKALEKELPRKNNMAYAMAAIIGTAIYITKGVDLPVEEVEALAAGFNDVLGTTPEWKKAPVAQKQILYESTLLNIVLMIMESQAEDQETKDIAIETARNVLASFGVER